MMVATGTVRVPVRAVRVRMSVVGVRHDWPPAPLER